MANIVKTALENVFGYYFWHRVPLSLASVATAIDELSKKTRDIEDMSAYISAYGHISWTLERFKQHIGPCTPAHDKTEHFVRAFGDRQDRLLLRTLNTDRTETPVVLAVDTDGVIKVWKEIRLLDNEVVQSRCDPEDAIYKKLQFHSAIPHYHGTEYIGDDKVIPAIRQSFVYGQPLSDLLGHVSVDEACLCIRQIARLLLWLHRHNIWYLDVRPENFLLHDSKISLIDFNSSRIVKRGQQQTNILIADPRYATPEGTIMQIAHPASDVFQLGILFHQLLEGHHPFGFDHIALPPEDVNSFEDQLIRYSMPNAITPYTRYLQYEFRDARLSLIQKMLSPYPAKRPHWHDIINHLPGKKISIRHQRRQQKRSREKNCVLFVARMGGIPHKGHIEYICRLLELGFYVIISLQKSYTLTDTDPIPKWLVMKMVAQSLFDRGFTTDDFHCIFTPYYPEIGNGQTSLYKLHFAQMPWHEDVIAIASGNPDVHKQFPHHHILDQKSVFGHEGKEYTPRSWGTQLRQAVKNNDYHTFQRFAATGVERIRTFEELRSMYGTPEIPFVEKGISLRLYDSDSNLILKTGVLNYYSPEEILVRALKHDDQDALYGIIDPYARDTRCVIHGIKHKIKYIDTEYTDGYEIVNFQAFQSYPQV